MREYARVLGSLVGNRGRLIAVTGGWSLAAKTCTLANLLLSVPAVLGALGPEKFGAWATLVSLVVFAGFLDFGLGNGTMNLVAGAKGRGDEEEIATITTEGLRSLLGISLCLGASGMALLPFVPWAALLGLPDSLSADARAGAIIVLIAVVLSVPLNLATRVQLGLGSGERALRWVALGQLVTLGLVVILARSGSSLSGLVAASVITPLLGSAANTLLLWRDPIISRHVQVRSPAIAKKIRREGLLFFILQLAAALAFTVDLPLIAALDGPTNAGAYAIAQRAFAVIPLSLGLIWLPLWPVYRQALAAKDHLWIKRTIARCLTLALALSLVMAIALVVGFDFILGIWITNPPLLAFGLLVGLAVWSVLESFGTAISTFLNAASIMRFQVLVASVFAVCCFATKVWAIARFGMIAAPWATATTYFALSLLPTVILGRRLVDTALTKEY